MIHLVAAAVALLVILRLVRPQPWRLRWRVLASVAVLAVSQHQLVTRTFFGTLASPEIPHGLLVGLGWLFGALLLVALPLLLRDGLRLVAWVLRARRLAAWLARPVLGRMLGLAALALSGYGVWEAVRVPDVRRVEIELAHWPAALDGFRLVQLTDLHASRLLQGPWMQQVVERTNALDADMIVITGDLVDGTPQAREHDVAPLAGLKAPLGVFAITGNHEYYVDYPAWLPAFRQLGLQMLINEHRVVGQGGRAFVLAGITDVEARQVGQAPPNFERAIAGAPVGLPLILLNHRPFGARRYAQRGVDLQLSGHTHGGQVLGAHWLTARANQGFVSGLYAVGDLRLYVSNGSGLWPGFPLRLGVPSEITEITLRSPRR